jgi:hypothetical protein
MKTSFSILVFCLVSAAMQAQSRDDVRWIERVRNTSVEQLEEGLPAEHFDRWFADLVKPSVVVYEVHECSTRESSERLLCVIAHAKLPEHPGWRPWLEVRVAVGVLGSSVKPDEPATVTPMPSRFIDAREGPANPMMKRPDRYLNKLRDVEETARAMSK